MQAVAERDAAKTLLASARDELGAAKAHANALEVAALQHAASTERLKVRRAREKKNVPRCPPSEEWRVPVSPPRTLKKNKNSFQKSFACLAIATLEAVEDTVPARTRHRYPRPLTRAHRAAPWRRILVVDSLFMRTMKSSRMTRPPGCQIPHCTRSTGVLGVRRRGLYRFKKCRASSTLRHRASPHAGSRLIVSSFSFTLSPPSASLVCSSVAATG